MPSPAQIRRDLRQSYRDIARDFDASRSRPWPVFETMAEHIPDECKLLDLGCGNGRLYEYLEKTLKKKVDYTGVDFCPELLELARKKYPRQDFEEQDISALDLDRRFDVITAVASFHHIPSRRVRQQTLKRIRQHLEDDGTFILSVWNLWQWKYWAAHVKAWGRCLLSFFRSDPRDLMIPFGKGKVLRYYHAFWPSELRRALKKAGLRILKWEVSGHNYLAICEKNSAVAPSDPVPVRGKKIRHSMSSPSAVASYKRSS